MLIVTGASQIYFRQLDDDSFLVIALEPTGIVGKARYLARTLVQEIREAL
jgi:predicted regulator of Ras-like GTPase activity (Roadblock/LC7/MglB family)